MPFTRSRSPAVAMSSVNPRPPSRSQRTSSPSVSLLSRHKPVAPGPIIRSILPSSIEIHCTLPLVPWIWTFCIDTRKAGECLMLLGSTLYAASKLSDFHPFQGLPDSDANVWISIELFLLSAASLLYIIWTHSALSKPKLIPPQISPSSPSLITPVATHPHSPISPRVAESREFRRSTSISTLGRKSSFGFIWMSVPKNYRESSDDGIFTGLLLGPLIASALLYSSLQQSSTLAPSASPLPTGWLIEAPVHLVNPRGPSTPLEALVLSRYNLVDLSTFCSTILLFHVCASRWIESRYSKRANAPEGERRSVPRSEGLRSWYYIVFTIGVSLGVSCIRASLEKAGIGLWQHMNYFDVIVASSFYQFTLYIAIRLAHRGFTLGELGLVCFGGTTHCMELLNITIARIWPVTTPYIKTYRLPTPLLIFQIALIAGSFLTGFLLSPFLVLSRHIAQRPVRRLRYPEEKQRHRRYLALGFYIGAVLIVGGLIGMWTRWCLGKRDPWLWAIFRLLEGRKKWSRPALLAYWALMGSLSVAGWNRQLARSRRYRSRNAAGENLIVPGALDTAGPQASEPVVPSHQTSSGSGGPLSLTFPNLPNLPNGANVSNVATDLLDAADKHVPTLSLNARRKFFHALAVVMFIPGVAFDPAFTHLSFSVAFALFIFAEYVRYFAIYPFGAVIHLFMNEFLDHKDGGTAILSHFYLLTGCAGSVWLEGPSRLLQFTGILALGVGDALASIVGKRMGTHRWSPTTSKTLEGSAAYTLSVVLCAWLLRMCGLIEGFSTVQYATIVGISSVLEALSVQNDNLTLPLYMWSMLVLAL